MPACTVEDEDGVRPFGDRAGDFCEVGVHRLRVSIGHDQRGGGPTPWADGAEDVGPDAGQRALLADPRFILKPHLQRLAPSMFRQRVGYPRGEVFLNVSWVSGSDFGCCGRTESRRNPSATADAANRQPETTKIIWITGRTHAGVLSS